MRAILLLLIGLAAGWSAHMFWQPLTETTARPASFDGENGNFARLLIDGRIEQAMRSHQSDCGERFDACRNAALAAMRGADLDLLQRRLSDYLRSRPDDVAARYYRALAWHLRGRNREALDELLDLRFQIQPPLELETVRRDIEIIFEAERRRLRGVAEKSAGVDFLRFMILKDNSQQSRYLFLMAEELNRSGQPAAALGELAKITYDPEWGETALALSRDIKAQFRRARADRRRDIARARRPKGLRVDLRRSGAHFTVEALLDNRHRLSLLIDTGASITAVRGRLAERLGLDARNAPRIRLQTANGVVRAPLTRVDRFAIADLALENFELALLPDSAGEGDGLLGMNYLRRFDFYIDQDEAALYLAPRR